MTKSTLIHCKFLQQVMCKMSSTKTFRAFLIILHLQPIIEVKAEVIKYEIHPQYHIPSAIVQTDFPNLHPCITSINYAKNGNITYLGLRINNTEYIYSEVHKRYNQDDDLCDLDAQSILRTREMIFIADDNQFMMLIKGKFKINYRSYTGVLVLMEDNWRSPLLENGLAYFNISHTVNQSYNLMDHTNAIVNYVEPHDCNNMVKYCANMLSDDQLYIDGAMLWFLGVSLGMLVVICAVCKFWYKK